MLSGQQARVRHISIQGLVPQTDNYMTYDGSLTQPGCQETVTWIIINKPLYISADNVRLVLVSLLTAARGLHWPNEHVIGCSWRAETTWHSALLENRPICITITVVNTDRLWHSLRDIIATHLVEFTSIWISLISPSGPNSWRTLRDHWTWTLFLVTGGGLLSSRLAEMAAKR